MRKTRLFMFCGAAALAIGVAGCNREAMDTEPATTADAAADTATMPADTAATDATTGAESLTLATGSNGQYLADASGRAVYMLEGDAECTGECLTTWPPVVVTTSTPVVGPNLQSGLVSTVQRDDGTLQLTYNGHPLYYYAQDTGAGMAMGHDVDDAFGQWYLVGPGGIALTDTDTSAGVTAEVPRDDELDATDDMAPPAPVDDTNATDEEDSGNAPQTY